MGKAPIINMRNIVVSNSSYSTEFFEELFHKIGVTAQTEKHAFKQAIRLASDEYLTLKDNNQRELPPSEIKDKLEKSSIHIRKATKFINDVATTPYYSEALVNNLFDVIQRKHPALHDLLDEIIRPNAFGTVTSLPRSLDLLSAMTEGIEQTIDNFESEKKTNKSEALHQWIMRLSPTLEPLLGRKLEQSRYHDGEYVSKREINDSELLLFIISPLDPEVTITQLETAIKNTHKERHTPSQNNHF